MPALLIGGLLGIALLANAQTTEPLRIEKAKDATRVGDRIEILIVSQLPIVWSLEADGGRPHVWITDMAAMRSREICLEAGSWRTLGHIPSDNNSWRYSLAIVRDFGFPQCQGFAIVEAGSYEVFLQVQNVVSNRLHFEVLPVTDARSQRIINRISASPILAALIAGDSIETIAFYATPLQLEEAISTLREIKRAGATAALGADLHARVEELDRELQSKSAFPSRLGDGRDPILDRILRKAYREK